MIEITAYQCEYCKKKILKSKSGMRSHEKKCFWNPETRSCMTCNNYTTGENYPSRCKYDFMNKNEVYGENEIYREIKKLQTNCDLYKYDGLTFEERKQAAL